MKHMITKQIRGGGGEGGEGHHKGKDGGRGGEGKRGRGKEMNEKKMTIKTILYNNDFRSIFYFIKLI